MFVCWDIATWSPVIVTGSWHCISTYRCEFKTRECSPSVPIMTVRYFQATMGSSKSDLQSVVHKALSDFVQEHIPSASLE